MYIINIWIMKQKYIMKPFHFLDNTHTHAQVAFTKLKSFWSFKQTTLKDNNWALSDLMKARLLKALCLSAGGVTRNTYMKTQVVRSRQRGGETSVSDFFLDLKALHPVSSFLLNI